MNTADQLKAIVDRWQKLPHDDKAIPAAGFFGRLIGTSYMADAISFVKVCDLLEQEVESEEREHAARLQAQQVTPLQEADE